MPSAPPPVKPVKPVPTDPRSGLTPEERQARAHALDVEIQDLHRRRNEDGARLARKLEQLHQDKGYVELGFGSLTDYAWQRLGWGYAKVRDLLRLLARLERMPLLREAYDAGELPWTKAVLAARATARAPEEEAYWLKEAGRLDPTELGRKVSAEGKDKGGIDPDAAPDRSVRGLSAEDEAWLDEWTRKLRSQGRDVTRGEAIGEACRLALLLGGHEEGGAAHDGAARVDHEEAKSSKGGERRSAVSVLLKHCTECRQSSLVTRSGEVRLRSADAEPFLRDSEAWGASGQLTRWVPREVQRQILFRSEGRCEVPGCNNRNFLQFHHNRGWRAGHDPHDMVHLCSRHHGAIHQGRLRIRGSWRSGLRFELWSGEVLGERIAPEGSSEPVAGATVDEPSGSLVSGTCDVPASPSDPQPISESEAQPAAGVSDPAPSSSVEGRNSVAEQPELDAPEEAPRPTLTKEQAIQALRSLQLPVAQARALLARALEEEPDLLARPPDEALRELLRRLPSP